MIRKDILISQAKPSQAKPSQAKPSQALGDLRSFVPFFAVRPIDCYHDYIAVIFTELRVPVEIAAFCVHKQSRKAAETGCVPAGG